MKIKHYRARKTLFSWGIYWFQKYFLNFSEFDARDTHVEAFFEDGVMIGSTELDGGVRAKHMREFKDHWGTTYLEVTKKEENHCRSFLEARIGKKMKFGHIFLIGFLEKLFFGNYDRAGILFAQLLRTNWFLRKNCFFCSELIVEMMQDLLKSEVVTFGTIKRYKKFIGVTPHMVSPAQLTDLFK